MANAGLTRSENLNRFLDGMDKGESHDRIAVISRAATVVPTQFKLLPSDVILASFPKTGTTWLISLTISILTQNNLKMDGEDPLIRNHPHELVRFLDFEYSSDSPSQEPHTSFIRRVFRTHSLYSMLHDQAMKANNSSDGVGCRIVYIARNPADTLVSQWHFVNKMTFLNNNAHAPRVTTQSTVSLEAAFDAFCVGSASYGCYFDHILEYWNASKNSDTILFLTYEGLKKEPHKHVRRLADFLDCSLSGDQIEQVIQNCEHDRLKKLEVNQDGRNFSWAGVLVSYGSFFRRGIVGDSNNYLSPEMTHKLHNIAVKKWEGSGLVSQLLVNQ